MYKRALRIEEEPLGPEHPNVATTLNNMAMLLGSQGEYEEALPLIERALRIKEEALGPEHPDVAAVLSNMGGLLKSKGRYRIQLRGLHIQN